MMMTRNEGNHTRSIATDLKTRSIDDTSEKVIEGYFSTFNDETELFPGAFEEIDKTAFNKTLNNDIRALVNHDSNIVLGRTKSNTLELRVDDNGLYGSVKINENDTDALNLYERVKRGDVDSCSFGFRIIQEDTEFRDDDSIKWTIKEVDLHEVSIVTFPAYDTTSVQARMNQKETLESRRATKNKAHLRERLNNVKTTKISK